MRQLLADFRDTQCARRVDFAADKAPDLLVRALRERGFALVTMEGSGEADLALKTLSAALHLGDPYVPALYQYAEAREYSASYSDIRSDAGDRHPGFSTTAGQGWHVDGLLDAIGVIKTTVLYCVRAAHRGGETLLFNSPAAFAELRRTDPAAAKALLTPDVLTRRATLPGVDASATGPAFSTAPNGDLMTRYTDNETCEWAFSAGPPGALHRALAFLRAASEEPRYRLSVRLAAGEALVFRNDRLSHGRQPYEDAPAARRHLVRALYTRAPAAIGRTGPH
ncbi:TauD/TfdA family dioxygenase [Streptomyces sp. NPDC057963]|uniref:TauD/TfdA family dioxygenase n=1 Tax=Streptomyces sp. NPDC057963 TaxID=3346290 RepID=UPI0036E989F5